MSTPETGEGNEFADAYGATAPTTSPPSASRRSNRVTTWPSMRASAVIRLRPKLGFVANQPIQKGGACDADGCDKASSFLARSTRPSSS